MFKRTVSIDGVLYRQHEVYSIEHLCKKAAEASTFVKVKSTAGTESKSTRHELPLDVGMTFENAEETIMTLPFFSEVEDPYADVVASLEEQAQQQASIIGELESQAEQQSAIIGELEGQAQQQSAIIGELEGQAEQQSALIDEISGMLDDDEAATVPQAFKEWAPDTAYNVGDRRRHADKLYKCLQPHTSQADQTPDVAVSLWARIIASDDPDNPLPWVQPDSTNPYMAGDRVTHNGHTWESDIDYNVYEPGVAGWTCLDPDPAPEPEPTPEPEPEPSDIPVWSQPDSTNPYMRGDKVHFPTIDDSVYESDYDNNVWAPNVFGWHVVEAD